MPKIYEKNFEQVRNIKFFNNDRYEDSVEVCRKYGLFPPAEDWEGKILLLETSEEQPAPEAYRKMLNTLKQTGMFDRISGILIGKPMDEKYCREYQEILVRTIDNPSLSVVWNLNIGHAVPRCILPFGIPAVVDADAQTICFSSV